MQTELLTLLIFLFVVYDAKLTIRRINEYGLDVEINKGIRAWAKKFGPEIGVPILLFGPTLFWVLIAVKFNLIGFLGLIAGFKLRYFFNQLESAQFEREAKAIRDVINSRSRALPSQSKSEQDSDPSQTGPTNSEE